MANVTPTMIRKRVAGRMIEDNYRLQIIEINPKYELVLASDLKKNGQPKYYRSQHVLSDKRSKQVRHVAYQRSLAMHARNVANCDRKRARSEKRAADRRAQRAERKAMRAMGAADRIFR